VPEDVTGKKGYEKAMAIIRVAPPLKDKTLEDASIEHCEQAQNKPWPHN